MTETSCFQEAWLKPEVYLPGSQPFPELGLLVPPCHAEAWGRKGAGPEFPAKGALNFLLHLPKVADKTQEVLVLYCLGRWGASYHKSSGR